MTDRPRTILMLDRAGAQSIWSLMGTIRQAAEARGHVVHTLRWDDGRGAQEDRSVTGPHDHVIRVPPKRHPWDTLIQHRRFAAPFAHLLRRLQPDILHTNFIVPGGLGMRIARRAGVPRIIATRHELAGSLSPHLRLWSTLCAPAADHLVHVSSTVAQSYGCTTAQVYREGRAARALVIRNGIDLKALAQVEGYPRPPDVRVIVVAGRMVPVKGQVRALNAFARAAQRDPALRLELIGDGPDRPTLELRAQEAGLADRVDFTGWRPRDETLARMKSAWRVVVPSEQEGFGLSLAEAMALAAPVMASDIAVFREVVSMGSGVTLVNCENPEWLAEAILAERPAVQAPSDQLDKNVMVNAYVSLYETNRKFEE